MNITIVNVETVQKTAKNNKPYEQLEVVYKGTDGKVGNKTIFSFANPSVFASLKGAKNGDKFGIDQIKNDKGYWEWTKAGPAFEDAAPVAAQAAPVRQSAPAPTRDFETKEERALRQRLIVRQSSLSSAVSILSPGATKPLDEEQVISLAEKLTAWVFEPPALTFDSMEDDIPY